jgi:hypothetical protein
VTGNKYKKESINFKSYYSLSGRIYRSGPAALGGIKRPAAGNINLIFGKITL